jgi:hypothetical protein
VRRHSRIWPKELTTTKTILSRLRKLENGHLPPVETEAGRRVREANERLRQRIAKANERLKAFDHESPEQQLRVLTESERMALSGLTLGQRIRHHTQRRRDWMAEIGRRNATAGSRDALKP